MLGATGITGGEGGGAGVAGVMILVGSVVRGIKIGVNGKIIADSLSSLASKML